VSDVVTTPHLFVEYDRASDVLYVSVGRPRAARSREREPGLVWRHSVEDGQPIGVTIVDFLFYWLPKKNELATLIERRLGVPKVEFFEATKTIVE
jgi:hypothetical protein